MPSNTNHVNANTKKILHHFVVIVCGFSNVTSTPAIKVNNPHVALENVLPEWQLRAHAEEAIFTINELIIYGTLSLFFLSGCFAV